VNAEFMKTTFVKYSIAPREALGTSIAQEDQSLSNSYAEADEVPAR
jgi:hypothetical protein